jgi:hypothetical protein
MFIGPRLYRRLGQRISTAGGTIAGRNDECRSLAALKKGFKRRDRKRIAPEKDGTVFHSGIIPRRRFIWVIHLEKWEYLTFLNFV